MNNKITALIVTYKRPKMLRRAIESVIGQTYNNLQLSVFDDASEDETENVVSSYIKNDSRINYHQHDTNIGALANFRFAFESVETPYFSILSDDDCLTYDLYENAVNVLDNNPDIMFVILNTLMIDENSNLKVDKTSTDNLHIFRGKKGFDEFHSGNIPVTWTGMVFRKDVAKIYIDMDDRFDIGHDIRFLVRATSRYDFAYLSKVGAFFTQHSNSISSTIKPIDFVHQGVQASRYIEVIHDREVVQEIKDRAHYYLRKLLFKKPNVLQTLRNIVKNFSVYSEYENKQIEESILDYKYAGFIYLSFIFDLIHRNRLLKFFTYLTIGKIYKRKLLKRKLKMNNLQNGIYKKHFDYINNN